jgi:hypothetical protein
MFGFEPDSIVRLTRSGAFTILKSFGAASQIARPLAIGGDGNIYGQSLGGFFRVTPAGEFDYIPSNLEDRSIFSGLVRGYDGGLYYVGHKVLRLDSNDTFQEVASSGQDAGGAVTAIGKELFAGNDAVIERIDPVRHRRSTIHAFSWEQDGSGVGAITAGVDAELYVTTRFDGPGGGGTIGRVPLMATAPLRGDYFGVLKNTWGTLRVTLTTEGQLSGVLLFEGEKFALRTALGNSRVATFRFARAGKPELLLQLTFEGDTVGGVLTAGESIVTVAAERAPWILGGPVPQAGKYTVALDPTTSLPNDLPAGSGYAVMTVKRNGRIVIAGRLADGVPFSVGSVLATDGTFPVVGATPNGSREVIAGTVTFHESRGYADCDGELQWRRDAGAGTARYANGFSLDVRLLGCRYTPRDSLKRVLALDAGGHASIELGIPAPGISIPHIGVSIPIIITSQNIILQPPLLSMSIDLTDGLFRGTFIHPEDGVIRRMRGVFLQKQNRAAGHFVSPVDSGVVAIVPEE